MTIRLYNAHTNYAPFAGELINGIRLPGNVAQVWSTSELLDIGLWPASEIAPADPIPEGKISTGVSVQEIEGVPTFVHALVDAPAPLPNLSPLPRWRFKAMLRLTGHQADINAWLASLLDPESPNHDPATWAVASAILEDSDEYRFDHPLTETLRQIVGVTVEQLEALWDNAHGL